MKLNGTIRGTLFVIEDVFSLTYTDLKKILRSTHMLHMKSRHFVATSNGTLKKQNLSNGISFDNCSQSNTMKVVVSNSISKNIRDSSSMDSISQISPAASVCIRDHFSRGNCSIEQTKAQRNNKTAESFDIRSW